MSLLNKKWKIVNNFDYQSFQEKIYKNRDLGSIDSMEAFLYPSLENNLHDPYKMRGMQQAVQRIKQAVQVRERVVIFGDYDVDGVTSTFLMYSFLKKIGAQVSYRIPHRVEEGYGLKNSFIDDLADNGVSLIVTVDCGIANKSEIDYAKEKGMEVVVTDHHNMPLELPDAVAIVNPKQLGCEYPFKDLAGVGVAYKLITALAYDYFEAEKAKKYLEGILDIVALGTIADCMPLVEENRVLVKFGIAQLAKTENVGLRSLMKQTGVNFEQINTDTVAFGLAPRLNVAGRLKHAYHSLDLLIGKKENAKILDVWNKDRQDLVAGFLEKVEKELDAEDSDKPYILLKSSEWHAGIVGLIAGRLTEKYGYPSIVIEEREDIMVGSCRSIEAIDIYQALTQAKDLFEHFGGHKQAAGFAITPDKYLEFEDRMNFVLRREAKKVDFRPVLKIECEIKQEDICWENLQFLEPFAPFGIGNEKPNFLLTNVIPEDIHLTGKQKNHLKFNIQTKKGKYKVIGFNHSFMHEHIKAGKPVDVVFKMEKNEWKGRNYIQLRLVDMRVST